MSAVPPSSDAVVDPEAAAAASAAVASFLSAAEPAAPAMALFRLPVASRLPSLLAHARPLLLRASAQLRTLVAGVRDAATGALVPGATARAEKTLPYEPPPMRTRLE